MHGPLAFRGGVLHVRRVLSIRVWPRERLKRAARECNYSLAIGRQLVDALQHRRRRVGLQALSRWIERPSATTI